VKNYANIEKHPLHKGVYLGYDAQGYAWRIGKSNSSFGNWCATSQHHPNKYLFAFGLEKMSCKLSEFN
jgi:hypothetical protein